MKETHFRTGHFSGATDGLFWFVLSGKQPKEVYLKYENQKILCEEYPEFPVDFFQRNMMVVDEECFAYRGQIENYNGSKPLLVVDESGRKLHKCKEDEKSILPYAIDTIDEKEKSIIVSGWCMTDTDFEITCSAKEGVNIRRIHRYDANNFFPDIKNSFESGFEIRITKGEEEIFPLTVELKDDRRSAKLVYKYSDLNRYRDRGFYRYVNKFGKAVETFHEDGMEGVIFKVKKHFSRLGEYDEWIKKYEPTRRELNQQREDAKNFKKQPKISLVIPVYRTREKHLMQLLDSVKNQTYPNWELCLADAGADETGHSVLAPILEKEAKADSRIKYQILKENKSIAENTNEAIKMATGEFIAFCDHDDTLSLEAFYSIVEVVNAHEDCDFIYSDQDFLDETGKKRGNPLMKPDFSIDFLRCCNYISHLHVVSKALLDEVGMLDVAYDGSQDYEFTFRCVEKAKGIYHIPKVLYHWRMVGTSTADDPGTKTYAYEAGKRAIDDHFKRCGIPATAEITEYYGKYRIHYHWNEKPLVSVLIPNKDHVDTLDTCVQSLLKKLTYPNYEIIIIENNSEEDETFSYYDKIQKQSDKVRVIYYEGTFNYSKINNFGAANAKGEYLWLLNNDTEIINEDFLDEMMGYAQREDVGIVGARLFYEDGSIQHAGVVMGYGQVAGHAFLNYLPGVVGMLGRVVSVQNYSAVTAACLVTRKSVFEKVGGLTEEFTVAFNDVDYCMKVRSLGKLVVYTPFATAYHYESKSRGYEDTPEKQERFAKESDLLRKYWGDIIFGGDPYYSPNLTLDEADFSLRKR